MEVLRPPKIGNIISMKNMVDMALGNEIGVVNFNILHSLLHAILSKLELEEMNVEMSHEETDIQNLESKGIPLAIFPYHGLGERIKILENQVNNFNSLPSNKDIVNILSNPSENEPSELINQHSIKFMWQTINMRKQLNSNEEGIDKLAGLIDSVFDEIKQIKSENNHLKKQLENLTISKDAAEKIDKLQNDFSSLLAEFNIIKEKLSEYPSIDVLNSIVTWKKLESALKGIRADMGELKNPMSILDVDIESTNGPQNSISNCPSETCYTMLEKLGRISDDYEMLDHRVVKLENDMSNKIDKQELDNLKIPEDILETIRRLESQINSKDSEDILKIKENLIDLQHKMNIFNDTLDKISFENKDLLLKIEEAFGAIKDHDHRKADIQDMDELLKMKADTILLDTKLSTSLFDETTESLKSLINDLLKKLLSAEEELKSLLKLSKDVNGKVDKDDLNSLKEWFEKRFRKLADGLKNVRNAGGLSEDDAAGFRKQLLQHFHCISCDRPLDILSQGINHSTTYPDQKGLSTTRSLKPYITYDLEGIRQQMKSYGADIIDVYQPSRPCGGTVYPSKKIARPGSVNNSFPEEDSRPKAVKEELELQGIDGHIYKGRLDRSQTTLADQSKNDKFPPVTPTQARNQARSFATYRPKSSVRMNPRQPINSGNVRASSARVKLQETRSRQSSPVQDIEQNNNQNSLIHKPITISNGTVDVNQDNLNLGTVKSFEVKDHEVDETVLLL